VGEPLRIEELASRVSDGESVDWAAERARARNPGELRLVEALASLDRLAIAIRSSGSTGASSADAPTKVDDDPMIGTAIGPYRIETFIGRGGMGLVYRAYHPKLDRSAALKFLPPELSADESASRRFQQEAKLACLVSHPYVATVYDVIEQDARVVLVMEWIRGRTLDAMLDEGAMPWRRVAALGAEVAEALEAIHHARIVHRDLKPGNVMLSIDGHIKVMDFGVALHVFHPSVSVPDAERLTGEDRRVGTLLHMSPEQLRGEDVDGRSDLFALGILLWEMATGAHPFLRTSTNETIAAILNDPPGPAVGGDPFPEAPRLREVVLKLLEKRPSARFGSAAEVAAELRAIASSAEHRPPPPAPRRSWWRAAAAVSLTAAALLAGKQVWDRLHPVVAPDVLPVVAILPFEDRDGAPGSVRGELIASLAGAGLSESRFARPVDLDRLTEAFGAHPAARAIASGSAEKVRAKWIVAGQVWTESATLAGTVSIYEAGRDEPVAQHPLRAGGPSGIAAIVAARTLEAVAPAYRGNAPTVAAATTRSDEAREQLVRARAAMRGADYATAIAALERAVAIDPSFAEARTALAGALYSAGWGRRSREEAARAVADAERAGSSLPERVLLEARAVAAQVGEKMEDERAARRTLVERYRDDPRLLASYADSLGRGGKRDEGLGVVTQAEALDPTDLRILLVKARILNGLQKYDDASAVLTKAEQAIGDGGPAEARAEVAMHQGLVEMSRGSFPAAADRYATAERLFRQADVAVRAARAHRSVLDAGVVQGKLQIGSADYQSALNTFRSAGALQDVVDVLNVVGGRDFLAGEYTKAEPTLRAAVQEGRILENPELLVYPQLNLAILLSATGRIAEAEGVATEAVAAAREAGLPEPEAFGLNILASVHLGKGNLVKARDAYRSVADLASAPGASGEQLGFALMGVADIDETIGATKDGLEAADGSVKELRERKKAIELAYSLIVRARLRSQIADWDGSEADLAEAEKLAGAAGAPVESLKLCAALARGDRLLRLGRFTEAAREYDRVHTRGTKIETDEITALAAMGACHASLASARLEAAESSCRAADTDRRATPRVRYATHALMAEIALRQKHVDEAEQWGRRAAGEAREASQVTVELRALSVLCAIPGLPDREDLARRATSQLAAYLDQIPEPRRAAVRERADWKVELDRIQGSSNAD